MASEPSAWQGGNLSISRTTSNVREDYISLRVETGDLRLDVEVELAEFAQVLTGLGRVPVATRTWTPREETDG